MDDLRIYNWVLSAPEIISLSACPVRTCSQSTGCVACPPGQTSPLGSVASSACVVPCPAYAAFAPGTTTCECSAGYTGPAASCAACAAGEYKALAGPGACDTCPAGTGSLPGSVSSVACGPPCAAGAGPGAVGCLCAAGQYKDTRVLNPPYAQRDYSSINANTHSNSKLDDLLDTQTWAPTSNSVGEWMQIDTGSPMSITGIISQGRGSVDQYVTEFKIQYKVLLADSYTPLNQNFTTPSRDKIQHTFAMPIYARYVKILAQS